MQVNSFLKHQVIYGFSLPLKVTTYKYHNTAKLFIVCTPNGAIPNISSLYVGLIIPKLPKNESASALADRASQ